MSYKAVEVGSKIPVNNNMMSHSSSEVCINGRVYVVEENGLYPREGYHERNGWIMDSGYDPDWYLK
jgi:hypothetical protein